MKDMYGRLVPDTIRNYLTFTEDDVTYSGPPDKKKLTVFKQYQKVYRNDAFLEKQKSNPSRVVFDTFYKPWCEYEDNIHKTPVEEVTYDLCRNAEIVIMGKARYTNFKGEFPVKMYAGELISQDARKGILLTYAGSDLQVDGLPDRCTGFLNFAVDSLINNKVATIDSPKYGFTITMKARYSGVGYGMLPLSHDNISTQYSEKRLLIDMFFNQCELMTYDVFNNQLLDYMCFSTDRAEDVQHICRRCQAGFPRYKFAFGKYGSMVCSSPCTKEGYDGCERNNYEIMFTHLANLVLTNYYDKLFGNIDLEKVNSELQKDNIASVYRDNTLCFCYTPHQAGDLINTYVFESTREDGLLDGTAKRYNLLEYNGEVNFDKDIANKSNREIIDYVSRCVDEIRVSE